MLGTQFLLELPAGVRRLNRNYTPPVASLPRATFTSARSVLVERRWTPRRFGSRATRAWGRVHREKRECRRNPLRFQCGSAAVEYPTPVATLCSTSWPFFETSDRRSARRVVRRAFENAGP